MMTGLDVYAIRKKLRLSQDGLARKIGVNQSTISEFEREIIRPSALNEAKLRAVAEGRQLSRSITAVLAQRNARHIERPALADAAICPHCLCWVGPTLPCGCP